MLFHHIYIENENKINKKKKKKEKGKEGYTGHFVFTQDSNFEWGDFASCEVLPFNLSSLIEFRTLKSGSRTGKSSSGTGIA